MGYNSTISIYNINGKFLCDIVDDISFRSIIHIIKFSKDKVLLLHQLIAQETGGSIGVRDEGLLESALEVAFSSFGGEEFYPSKEEKGAASVTT